jgi:hypothetical protein
LISFARQSAFFRASLILNLLLLAVIVLRLHIVDAQADALYFPETGHTVSGAFLRYWFQHGGLTQQGYPLTEEFQEASKLNGRIYTVQYFERAVFEKHPENAPPYDVLLSQLGKFELDARHPGNSNSGGATVTPLPTPTPENTPTQTNTPLPSPTPQQAIMSVDYCKSRTELANIDTFVCMTSDPGDYIGQGKPWIWTGADSSIVAQPYFKSAIEISTQGFDWTWTFAPPEGQSLFPGRYLTAERFPFESPQNAGLDASGDGRGCNTLSGQFEILDIVLDPDGKTVQRFAANFVQNCENLGPVLRGEVRYHSAVGP